MIKHLSILRGVILVMLNLTALFCMWSGPSIPVLKTIDLLWFSIFILTSIVLTDDDKIEEK